MNALCPTTRECVEIVFRGWYNNTTNRVYPWPRPGRSARSALCASAGGTLGLSAAAANGKIAPQNVVGCETFWSCRKSRLCDRWAVCTVWKMSRYISFLFFFIFTHCFSTGTIRIIWFDLTRMCDEAAKNAEIKYAVPQHTRDGNNDNRWRSCGRGEKKENTVNYE